MLKTILTIAFAASVVTANAGTASVSKSVNTTAVQAAAETETSWAFLAGYDTKYNFRGTDYGKNLAYADLGYSFALTEALSLEIGAWYAVVPEGINGSFTELDYYLTLDYAVSDTTAVGIGYTHYTYSGIDWADEPEIMAHVDHSIGSVDLSLLYAHDFEVKGDYIQLSASHTYEVNEKFALEPAVAVAYNNHYFMEKSGGSHVSVSLAAPIALSQNIELRPYITAQWAIDAAREEGLVEDDVFGGISMTIGF